MTITSEQLAAFADGELDEMTAARVRRAVEADPALASELEQVTQLRAILAARFDPVLAQPVPEQLSGLIEDAAKVVNLGDARSARQKFWQRQEIRFGGGLAVAASLALVVLVVGRNAQPADYAGTQFAMVLDDTLSGQTAPDGTKLLVSFRDNSGQACRGFTGNAGSGIACRDDRGWKLKMSGAAASQSSTQFRQAGSADAAIMAAAQEMADGPALDSSAEQAARADGWKVKPSR